MKTKAILLLMSLWFNFTYSQQKINKEFTQGCDKVLSQHFKSDEPGAAVLVSRGGQIIYKKVIGMANLESGLPLKYDNVFRIGSLTKQFTAVAILQLIEQGLLNLQDEITKFIPDYPTQGNKITIEHLLTHTSGIQNYTAMKDYHERMMLDFKPSEMIDHFKNEPIRFTPGTKWSYSNSNYFLLGYIIEIISKKTFPQYLEEHLLKPAGMNKSLYASDLKLVKNRVGHYSQMEAGFQNSAPISMTQPYAAGSMLSTIDDLFKWNQAIQSHKLIKSESLEKAYTNFKLADGKETNYGYGWRFGKVFDSPRIYHGGGINGAGATQIYLPKENIFVVVLTNCDCFYPEEVALRLAALASGKLREYKELTAPQPLLTRYEGVYENARGQQQIISLSDKKLISQAGRGPKSHLKSYMKDQFFLNELQTFEFLRNEKGEVMSLITKNLKGNEHWSKTDKSIPGEDGIKVSGDILESYVGQYEVTPEFIFSINKEQDKLFLHAPEQEKIEMFAETEAKFFLKVNDAEFLFVKDDAGKISKTIMTQGGRQADAMKVR